MRVAFAIGNCSKIMSKTSVKVRSAYGTFSSHSRWSLLLSNSASFHSFLVFIPSYFFGGDRERAWKIYRLKKAAFVALVKVWTLEITPKSLWKPQTKHSQSLMECSFPLLSRFVFNREFWKIRGVSSSAEEMTHFLHTSTILYLSAYWDLSTYLIILLFAWAQLELKDKLQHTVAQHSEYSVTFCELWRTGIQLSSVFFDAVAVMDTRKHQKDSPL